MPPPSSPVPRLSSVPSDVFTVQPSPAAHDFARLCQRSGRRTCGRLVRFWAMLSPPPRHHIASEQQPQGSASTVCHPALLVLVLVLFLQVVRKGIANEQTEQEEREPGRRLPPTSSPVLPFRLRLRFLLFFAMISSARSHLFALPSSCLSFLALLPDD